LFIFFLSRAKMFGVVQVDPCGALLLSCAVDAWTLLGCFSGTEFALKHSCDPTAFVVDCEGTSFLFAARACKQGEPVTRAEKDNLVSYPVGLRSRALAPYLKGRHDEFEPGVGCLCARCAEERHASETTLCACCSSQDMELKLWADFLARKPERAEAQARLMLAKPKLEAGLLKGLSPAAHAHKCLGPKNHLWLLGVQFDALTRLWALRGKNPAAEVDALLVSETLTAVLTLRDYVFFHTARTCARSVAKALAWALKLVHELRSRNKLVPAMIALQVYAACLCGLALGVESTYDKPTRRALWTFVRTNPDCLSVMATAGFGGSYYPALLGLCMHTARELGIELKV
jgi:hypothetical protein